MLVKKLKTNPFVRYNCRSRIYNKLPKKFFMLSICLLANAAELYDKDTGNKLLRCNEFDYSKAWKDGMPDKFCNGIQFGA